MKENLPVMHRHLFQPDPNQVFVFSGGAVPQWTQPAQHSEDTREDADGKQKSVTLLRLRKHMQFLDCLTGC